MSFYLLGKQKTIVNASTNGLLYTLSYLQILKYNAFLYIYMYF